jgi:hypothetical protein
LRVAGRAVVGGVAGTEGAGVTAFWVVVEGDVAVVVVTTLEVVVVTSAWEGGAFGRPDAFSDPVPPLEQAPATRASATTSTRDGRME